MNRLEDDVRTAQAMGLTYGQYKALTYKQTTVKEKPSSRRRPPRKAKRYADEEVFAMWQSGMTDAEIGMAVGVSRQVIQNWRDDLELPSTHKFHIRTQKYRLAKRQDGTYYAIREDNKF